MHRKATAIRRNATAMRCNATAMRRSAVTKPQKYAKNEVSMFSMKTGCIYAKRQISSAVGVFHHRHR